MDMGGGNMYAMWGKGRMFGGMFNRPPEMSSMPPFWLVYIHVKDVGKAVDIATKAGAFVQRPRMDIPGGTIAILGDPQGAGFALHDLSAGTATATGAEKAPSRATAKSKSKARSAKKATPKRAAENWKEVGQEAKANGEQDWKERGKEIRPEISKKISKEIGKEIGKEISKTPPLMRH
jgi:hypothetical protein